MYSPGYLHILRDLKGVERVQSQICFVLKDLTFQQMYVWFSKWNVDRKMWNISHLKNILEVADRNKVVQLLKFQNSAKVHVLSKFCRLRQCILIKCAKSSLVLRILLPNTWVITLFGQWLVSWLRRHRPTYWINQVNWLILKQF